VLRAVQATCDMCEPPRGATIRACRRPAAFVLWDPRAFGGAGAVLFLCHHHVRARD